jgi:hypothetical protein
MSPSGGSSQTRKAESWPIVYIFNPLGAAICVAVVPTVVRARTDQERLGKIFRRNIAYGTLTRHAG